jgi:hypothetical protein
VSALTSPADANTAIIELDSAGASPATATPISGPSGATLIGRVRRLRAPVGWGAGRWTVSGAGLATANKAREMVAREVSAAVAERVRNKAGQIAARGVPVAAAWGRRRSVVREAPGTAEGAGGEAADTAFKQKPRGVAGGRSAGGVVAMGSWGWRWRWAATTGSGGAVASPLPRGHTAGIAEDAGARGRALQAKEVAAQTGQEARAEAEGLRAREKALQAGPEAPQAEMEGLQDAPVVARDVATGADRLTPGLNGPNPGLDGPSLALEREGGAGPSGSAVMEGSTGVARPSVAAAGVPAHAAAGHATPHGGPQQTAEDCRNMRAAEAEAGETAAAAEADAGGAAAAGEAASEAEAEVEAEAGCTAAEAPAAAVTAEAGADVRATAEAEAGAGAGRDAAAGAEAEAETRETAAEAPADVLVKLRCTTRAEVEVGLPSPFTYAPRPLVQGAANLVRSPPGPSLLPLPSLPLSSPSTHPTTLH